VNVTRFYANSSHTFGRLEHHAKRFNDVTQTEKLKTEITAAEHRGTDSSQNNILFTLKTVH